MSLLPRFPGREDLLEQLRRAWELCRAEKPGEAVEVMREVETACAAAGIESAHVAWLASVAADLAGRPVEALRHVLHALRLDPLMPSAEQSLDIIVRRCRQMLVEGALDADLGMALYATLSENALADDACRVSYARHLVDYGRPEEALAVAQAVVLLNPNMAEGWRVIAAAANALGKPDLVHEAATRCRTSRTSDGWDAPRILDAQMPAKA